MSYSHANVGANTLSFRVRISEYLFNRARDHCDFFNNLTMLISCDRLQRLLCTVEKRFYEFVEKLRVSLIMIYSSCI